MSSIIKCGPSPSKLAFWVDWKMADIISPLPGCSKRQSGKSVGVEEQQIILNVEKYFQEESGTHPFWPHIPNMTQYGSAPPPVPGASLHSEALSSECGRECPGTGDCGPTRHVGAGRWGLLLADCSRVARATTPGPPPQPHGW